MPPEKSTRRLGRGLDALFNAPGSPASTETREGALREIPVSQIMSNPFQPRKRFRSDELRELAESLSTNGLLQPVTVRPSPRGKGYELIAGERRLRAALSLGWTNIPSIVKEMTDQEVLTLALVENLQRADLNPVEEAEGYEQLIRDFGHTQQTVSEMVGKDRSTVANVLRILLLPEAVRQMIKAGDLTAGQARPLLGLQDPARILTLARQVIEDGLSAREVERRVRETASSPGSTPRRGRPKKMDTKPAEVRNLEQQLRKHLQTDVSISLKPGNRGSVVIEFYSPEDLERVLDILGLETNPH